MMGSLQLFVLGMAVGFCLVSRHNRTVGHERAWADAPLQESDTCVPATAVARTQVDAQPDGRSTRAHKHVQAYVLAGSMQIVHGRRAGTSLVGRSPLLHQVQNLNSVACQMLRQK